MYLYKLLLPALLLHVSIYTFTVSDTQGGTIDFNNYQHKTLLIVNIATGNTERVNQLAGLTQLQQQYADKLVVIAFPSNSFGNESRSNAEIRQFCQSNYNTNFLVAAKGSVDSTGIQPLYNWLTKKTENGALNARVKGDYQKFLISPDGEFAGVFSGTVLPSDSSLISAITDTF